MIKLKMKMIINKVEDEKVKDKDKVEDDSKR